MDYLILKTGTFLRHRKPKQSRYTLKTKGQLSYVEYHLSGNEVVLNYCYVPREIRSKGIGTKLVRTCLDSFSSRGFDIIPKCLFIQHFIDENPQYHSFVTRWE